MFMKNYKFQLSIITITLNNYEGLIRTYNSIKTIISSEIEWVIIDGGSDDETMNFLNELNADERINITSERDKGIYDAMNKGIKISSGEYIWFLNSGDISLINSMEDINFNNLGQINVFNIRALNSDIKYIKWRGLTNNLDLIKVYPCIPHQSTIFEKTIFELYGNYKLDYSIVSDYEKYCLFYSQGVEFKFFKDQTLAGFVNDGISSKFNNSLKILREITRIQKKYFNRVSYKTHLYYRSRFLISLIFSDKINNKLRSILFKKY